MCIFLCLRHVATYLPMFVVAPLVLSWAAFWTLSNSILVLLGILRSLLGSRDPSWAILEPSWANLGACCGVLGAIIFGLSVLWVAFMAH